MKNKRVNLYDLTKLADDAALSERYVKYVSGALSSKTYHHNEIYDIKKLCKALNLDEWDAGGFVYGYSVPQLSKEFDLLKISEKICVDVELKSHPVPKERITKQLRQNLHYLKMLGCEEISLFTYVSEMNELYVLGDDGKAERCDLQLLYNAICGFESSEVDLDEVFRASKVLVSPLNDTQRFLEGRYLLTDHQSDIKKKATERFLSGNGACFFGVTGGPGTGKTLLVYDLARSFAEDKKVLIVHGGLLCEGHDKLNASLNNVRIVSAKYLNEYELPSADAVIVDEAQRLYDRSVEKIREWTINHGAFCLFSFDEGQKLSNYENRLQNVETVKTLCGGNLEKLTDKIRTNEEMAGFIRSLLDLSKFRKEMSFPNVKIAYVPNKFAAVAYAREAESDGYAYISYTPSTRNRELNYQESSLTAHKVIGQEFDGVCMILDGNFYYEKNLLKAKTHPNPNYLFEKLLYQGLTRVRSKLFLIVTERALLDKILYLFGN